MGRTHRPVHRRGPVHDHDGAPQAGRPADHRDRPRRRIPHPVTIRIRLTLHYAATFLVAGAIIITFTYLYLRHSLDQQLAERIATTEQLARDMLGQSHGSQGIGELHEALRGQFQQERNSMLATTLIWSLVALGVAGLLAGGFGWLMAGRALRPLQRITATARRVADRSLHERIALRGPDDELKNLADTFDAMLERLDRAFDGQRRFVANASHELRTPLTINRTLIQVALDIPDAPEATRELGITLLEVNQRHERLIDGLLLLATSDQHLTETGPVDLADIARRLAADAARDSGVEVRTTIAAAHVTGDPVLLERLTQNLLDNAIRYNLAEHGWLAITTGASDGHAHLTVENTGPTVAADQVDDLFEPFRRLASTDRLTDPASPDRGAGLGLSIVRSVTHAHDGQVEARPRPGGGLTVSVRLPVGDISSAYRKPHTC